jgi:hypothetical protein
MSRPLVGGLRVYQEITIRGIAARTTPRRTCMKEHVVLSSSREVVAS